MRNSCMKRTHWVWVPRLCEYEVKPACKSTKHSCEPCKICGNENRKKRGRPNKRRQLKWWAVWRRRRRLQCRASFVSFVGCISDLVARSIPKAAPAPRPFSHARSIVAPAGVTVAAAAAAASPPRRSCVCVARSQRKNQQHAKQQRREKIRFEFKGGSSLELWKHLESLWGSARYAND